MATVTGTPQADKANGGSLYATIWRWHLYAGLLVIPFVIILALTGSIYLFKPQIEHFEERHFQNLPVARQVTAGQQVTAALDAFPGAELGNYRLPKEAGDAAMVTVRLPAGAGTRQVFVAPGGDVLGSFAPKSRISEVAKKIHSQLLLGPRGSWLVELGASWAFVLMASGLYLWWPRGRRLNGVLWPRLDARGRLRWRDLHAVTAVWLYGLIAVLLLTSLPWTSVWGSAFQKLRSGMGWVDGTPEWTLGGEAPTANGQLAPAAIPLGGEPPATLAADPHAGHHAGLAMPVMAAMPLDRQAFDRMVAAAKAQKLPFPVYVTPPQGMGRFGVPTGDVWTVFSDTPNRPQQRTLTFDPQTQKLLNRRNYDGGNRIDKVIGYGIAWHEGQLFGWVNQLIGLLTAAGIVLIATTGFIMWRKREPSLLLPAQKLPLKHQRVVLIAILIGFAAFLPLLALSLAGLLLVDILWNGIRAIRWRDAT